MVFQEWFMTVPKVFFLLKLLIIVGSQVLSEVLIVSACLWIHLFLLLCSPYTPDLWLQVTWLRSVGIQFRGCCSPAAQTTPSSCGTSGAAKEPPSNCRDTSRNREIPVETLIFNYQDEQDGTLESLFFFTSECWCSWTALAFCAAIEFRVCAMLHTPASSSPAAVMGASSFGTWTLHDKRLDRNICDLDVSVCMCVSRFEVVLYLFIAQTSIKLFLLKTEDNKLALQSCTDLRFKTFYFF